ncbi:tyrosine-type recombinase/integrase [Actinoalloteichus hymeniacidonis]|uniref:Site-specific recombinase XerD n=1 Tax=Actinoalloteichus hymeniacidonis TaxID=340345 RepID=A0AAC9N0E9_9PSEU|nr:tyrosine-type recombinase/integrase [Actinoalloteichus hymeniacidonis]AOS64997.1 site-specific recombinase XerD [Actinoalloteichus hymeniacidonis]MBB5906927.1 integrase [Actinoalloteichus hymeniacidonis]
MKTTYDVRIWTIRTRYTQKQGKKTPVSYGVRWVVSGKQFYESFKTSALAGSFHADLLAAQRKGEAFAIGSGLPVSIAREASQMSWYEFACSYIDMKWPTAAGHSRKGLAQTLAAVTMVMLSTERGLISRDQLFKALQRWSFNLNNRAENPLEADRSVLRWVERNTKDVASLEDPETMRAVLTRIGQKKDGQAAAARTRRRKHANLHHILDYGVERGLLSSNPITSVKWTAPKVSRSIDRRSVINPVQARTLLRSIEEQGQTGARLVAFFGVMYYAGLRPAEAVNLRRGNLELPESGWGRLVLIESSTEPGKEWTDTGTLREIRELKHRAKGETRNVPVSPELTALLRRHLRDFGTGPDGLLFRGVQGRPLASVTYRRAWQRARTEVFTVEAAASPLAKRPYDLRHAAVSTWLTSGVPATQVAAWAGHSVGVLLEIYASCLDGQGELWRKKIEDTFGSH